ncbi:MAG: hypothetical protein NC122_06690 [Faecalibacterium sp.]|nr:hypothetical protein [Ruminococcus sp.]MCM1392141.1 hypothetical protein [Ruminococcus sp.]MCM1485879.1 hypothetical protein [Faecalibacterium sp.]
MNKEKYKQTFSGIYPSDEAIERIFNMTEKKNKRIKFKAMIVIAAIVALFTCATLTANAATDGAIFEGMSMIINGEEVNLVDYVKNYKVYTDKNGNRVGEYEFEIPDEKDGPAYISIYSDAVDSDSIGDISNNAANNNTVTTAAAK